METKTFNVPNISCGHCKMRVEKTLKTLNGVASANADVATKTVTLEMDDTKTEWEAIRAALEKIGYPPAG